MVMFSFKAGDQTVETESPNPVNKTGLVKRLVSKLFFISIKLFLETNST